MKKVFLVVPVLALILSSCNTSKIVTYSDDVYANPTEEKRLEKLAAEEKAKKEALEKQKEEEARLAQKAKDDANPYYQDPSFNSDDYYDYQYASRIRRFDNPIYGAGYYDNYYTNSYWYNQNPYMYGTSIYNSYNWLMPSNQFGYYSNGISLGLGYSSYYGNPYYGSGSCWNNGWGYNNPYYGYGYNPYGYNPYMAGYYNGYNNGYYSGYYGYPYGYSSWNNGGWGYFNSYDVNSGYSQMTYGVRGSNGGSNSPRNTSGGMAVPAEFASERVKFIKEVNDKQESAPRFTSIPRKVNSGSPNSGNIMSGNNNPVKGGYENNSPSNTNTGGTRDNWSNGNSSPNNGNTINGNSTGNNQSGNTSPGRNSSNRVSGGKQFDDTGNSGSSNKSSNSGWQNSGGNNSGGSSAPRGGNSGGSTNRPR